MQESESPWYKLIHFGLEFFGRYYSNYRGFVVDNNDPSHQNRIKVVIPGINPNTKIGRWAYPKNNWGGKDYGTSMLPQVNDMVIIEFANGDPETPFWSHAGYGLDEKPEELKPITNYGFKTPKKNLIVIEDGETTTDGKILVKFKTGKEYYLIGKELFELEAKLIKLGKNGDEWAVLGETLLKKLDSLITQLEQNQTLLQNHTHTTNAGPSGPAIQLPALEEIKTEFKDIRVSLNEALSNKVKLDK